MNIYDRLKAGTTPLMAKFKNPKSQVTYERLHRTPDGQGGYETAWTQVGAFDAVVLPASGTEQLEAQRLESQVSHKILALYDDANGITAADRILFDGRVFNVEAVTDIAEGEMWIKIMCREGVASGPTATPVLPSCAYPLDASDAELAGAGFNGRMANPTADDQQGSLIIADGSSAEATRYMAPSAATLEFKDLSGGLFAFEYDFTLPAFTPEGGGAASMAVLSGLTISSVLAIPVALSALYNQDGSTGIAVSTNSVIRASAALTTGSNRVGVLFDGNSGVVRVWANGNELTLTDDSLPDVSDVYLALSSERFSNDDNGAAGSELTVRLITDASEFTTPFPAGSSDICGNVFN